MTRSRSPSERISRSSSSETTRLSSTASSYNSGRRSSSSHRSITPEQSRNGIDYVSPLAPKERIPRKVEFRMAKDEVPAPPPVPQKTQRVRVSMSDVARERFDAHAAGIALSHTDRSTLLRELPLVASPLGEVPVVDEQLPKDSERAIFMRENDLRTIHETLLSTLNIIELVRKIGADGHGSDFPTAAVGYFDILGSIVSGSIMDIIVLRRERFLRSLAVDPKKAMPSYRRLPLAGSTMIHHMRQTVLPELFGKELRDVLASGESAISKSVQKLRAQSSKRKKPTTATSPYGKERCHESRRFRSELVGDLRIRLSAVRPGGKSDKEGDPRPEFDNYCCSTMEKPILVSASPETRGITSRSIREQEKSSLGRSIRGSSSSDETEEFYSLSLENLASFWAACGCDKPTTATLLASWAQNTRRQYSSALRRWHNFLLEQRVAPQSASYVVLCNFLSRLSEKGLSYSSIASHKAAITTVSDLLFGTSWSENALLTRFMKGLYRLIPPRAKYAAAWDVDTVLDHIISLGPNDSLTMKTMTLKLVMLLAICSPKRVSEIAALSLSSLQKSSRRWVFFIDFRNKNRNYGPPQTAVYEAFPYNTCLCPIRTLEDYLTATQNVRQGENNLLISYAPPHRRVTSSTVARWIRTVLSNAGIEEYFSAHSTRAASTSKARTQGLSLAKIMDAASWSPSGSTFQKFYNRELAEESYQRSILTRRSSSRNTLSREATATGRKKKGDSELKDRSSTRSTPKRLNKKD